MFLVTYPKSGTNWLGFLVASVINRQQATPIELTLDSFVDLVPDVNRASSRPGVLRRYRGLPSPRFFLTHGTPDFAAVFPKVVYLVRDPRDVMVSYYYHHRRTVRRFSRSLAEFVAGLDDLWPCPWPAHVRGWLDRLRGRPHLLVRYENMKRDTAAVLRDVLAFAGLSADPGITRGAVAASSFESVRALEERHGQQGARGDPRVPFIRAGKNAGFGEALDPELVALIERKCGDVMAAVGYGPQVGASLRRDTEYSRGL